MALIDLTPIVTKLQDELRLILGTVKEKGAHRFGRAILIGVAIPSASYYMVYAPAQSRLGQVGVQLQAARNTAKYSDEYKEYEDSLRTVYMQLPQSKDRTSFLSDAVKEALRSGGIVPTNFSPPTEMETQGGVIQSLTITMTVKFPDLMSFLSRLEANKTVIHINNLEITKKNIPVGLNEVNCGLSTIFLTEQL